MSGQNLTIVRVVRDGLCTEMSLGDEVLVMGENVGENGGVFRVMEGLWDEFGDDHVVDTLLAESGIADTAIGMATMGLRPVPEIQSSGFMYPGLDQIVSHMGRFRNRTRGRYTLPMMLRAPYGDSIRAPESHSESKEMFYAHETGLKVIIPSTPYDTKGLLISVIRDSNPAIFMEPKLIYRAFHGGVPEDDYTVPIDEATVRREDTDVSVFAFGAITRPTPETVENLEEEGIDTEVVDIQTISPLDHETIVGSFKKTGRTAVVHGAPRNGDLGTETTMTVREEVLLHQEAPIGRVAGYNVPYPLYAPEDYYLPPVARVEEDIHEAVNF